MNAASRVNEPTREIVLDSTSRVFGELHNYALGVINQFHFLFDPAYASTDTSFR